jgi:ribosomal protein L11 methyltransferase
MTYTAFTTLPSKDDADALAEEIEFLDPEPLGVGVYEIEDDSGLYEVSGYFETVPDVAALALLAATHHAKGFVISELPETDWVSHVQRELHPVEAGRFYLYGSHDAGKVPKGRIGLLIEASMAFGTGHHGTTLGCLLALDYLANQGFVAKQVVDIGCGTAVLGMAAARLWNIDVMASDIDAQAVDVAMANVQANGLQDQVKCLIAAGFDHPELQNKKFDLVFANILKGPLIDLAPEMAKRTRFDGYAILSGILNEQAVNVSVTYSENGFNLVHQQQIGDWTTLLLSLKTG